MAAHIEWIVGVAREGKQFESYGDEYDFAATIRIVDGEAEVMGAAGKVTAHTRKALLKELNKIGVTKLWWRRKEEIGDVPG